MIRKMFPWFSFESGSTRAAVSRYLLGVFQPGRDSLSQKFPNFHLSIISDGSLFRTWFRRAQAEFFLASYPRPKYVTGKKSCDERIYRWRDADDRE